MIFATLTRPHFDLSEALDAVDRADSQPLRLQALADALRAMGFRRVVVTMRDASFNATMVVSAGEPATEIPVEPLPGTVWRRRISSLERFRVGVDDVYMLDGTDAWVSREFFGEGPSAPDADTRKWLPTDLLVGLLRGLAGEVIGIVKMAMPENRMRPAERQMNEAGWLIRYAASRLSHDSMHAVSRRRAERLQRLQEAGAALARSLDEEEIVRELTRQAVRATGAESAQLVTPDRERDEITTLYRIVRGTHRPRDVRPMGDGVIAWVARTGRPFRAGDKEADRANRMMEATEQMPLSFDLVDDIEVAGSVLAVPLLEGIRLVGVLAVHTSQQDIFCAEDQEMLATMASQAATAIANARSYAKSEQERRQTEALSDVARAVSASLQQGEVLRLILRHAMSLSESGGACIALRDGDYMNIVSAAGHVGILAGVHLPVATSLLGHAVTRGEYLISNEYRTTPVCTLPILTFAGINRVLVVPLSSGGEMIGAFAVTNREDPYTDDIARVMQRLSDQVSVAIANARLFGAVERATREWKMAFDSIANGIVVLDEAGRVRRCNASAAQMSRAGSIPELLGEEFSDMLIGVSCDCSGIGDLMEQSRQTGEARSATVRDDERGMVFDMNVAPHPDGGSVITFGDITDRYTLEVRHRGVLEMASEAIIITGTDRRVVYANPAAHALFGREDITGVPTRELSAEGSHEMLHDTESAVMSGNVQRYELPVVRADGTERLVAISSAPLVEVGQITGTVACLRDITDHRAGSRALAQSEARYQRLVDSATDAIFTVDMNGCFTSVNRSMEIESGRSSEELLGVSCLTLVDERDSQVAAAVLRRVLAGRRQKLQLRAPQAGRPDRVVSMLLAPIVEEEQITGGLAIVRDVTDEEAERSMLREVTNGLSAEYAPVRVSAVVNRALDSQRGWLQQLGVSVDFDNRSEALEVLGSRVQLKQAFVAIFHNVANALAGYRGERALSVRMERLGNEVRVVIGDTGPGLSPAFLSRVFEPLYTTQLGERERNVGLAVVHAIIMEHGGRIEAESPGERGMIFTITLPLLDGPGARPTPPRLVSAHDPDTQL